ncbi:hypothetical protein ACIRST_40625 [Kitasatospora sp. NPDC101447]|uniref:hypothetical protein n=1 Tax=Kitasatospora sp. NPDC101447 TaxID=3364102 RepID=UPI0037FE822E
MRTAHPAEVRLPVVQEPRMRRCGHYMADFTREEARALSHLVLDRNAIQIADAINYSPERRTAQPVTPTMVRDWLNSLRVKTGVRTRAQLVDVACRAKLLLPPRAVLTQPLRASAVKTFQLAALGHTSHRIAAIQGISRFTVGSHLKDIRYRMRTRGTPAAVYRLHGVPGVLDSTPICLVCAKGGPR